MFNSGPTSPSIDFGHGYLLSFCIYCLLETQRLLVTPRQYGDGFSVLTQSGITSFHVETLDLCDLGRTNGLQSKRVGPAISAFAGPH